MLLFFSSCGFSPHCIEPKPGDLSYPVDGMISGENLFVLNSDQNFDYCSSFISVFKIDGDLSPIRTIFPENYEDFTLAGKIISLDGRIFVTERGKGMIFVFSEDGELLDYFEEGGNPYDILVVEGTLITANLKTNALTLYKTEKLEKITSHSYSYPPVSMVYHKASKKVFVGFLGTSDLVAIDFDQESKDYLKQEGFSISPDGKISSLKDLSLYENGMYAIMENPYSLLFVEATPPFSSSLLSLFEKRVLSVEIIEEKNLLLVISPFEDRIYGFSLKPFLFLWKIDVKGSPVRALYSERSKLIYIILMMDKKIMVLNPEVLQLR